ncbi:MAG: hypothetical protein IJG34_07575 [Synergistaceae bacterium]|nr:hypothetical protein [Synergistaceae bacterium]
MAMNLNDAEYFADTISNRIDQILNERKILRRELARKSDGTLEHEKSFVRAYQDNIINNAMNSDKAARLEHILAIR